MKYRLLAVLPLVALLGCVTLTEVESEAQDVRVGIVDPTPRTRNAGDFVLIHPGEEPKQTIKEIAVLSFQADAQEEGKALGAMIERARQLGAVGMILRDIDSPNKNLAIAHPIWQSTGERVFRASAFVYATP